MALTSTSSYNYVEKILNQLKETPVESTYSTVLVKGIPQNPTLSVEKFEDIIDNFITRSSDVFVATYVKVLFRNDYF